MRSKVERLYVLKSGKSVFAVVPLTDKISFWQEFFERRNKHMKYSQLFKMVMEQGGVTIRMKDYPDQIMMPTQGFVVGDSKLGMQLDDDQEDTFDAAIERALQFWADDFEFLNVSHASGMIYIDPVDVFGANRKEFAMGVAFGRQEAVVYDIAKDKHIPLR